MFQVSVARNNRGRGVFSRDARFFLREHLLQHTFSARKIDVGYLS